MSSLQNDLLLQLRRFQKARDKAEKAAAKRLIDLYEDARVEVLQRLLDRWGHLEQYELQHLESTMVEIERVLAPYTSQAADLRAQGVAEGWEIGQRLVARSLMADSGIAPTLASIELNLGRVNQPMVRALFGDLPKLAGTVTDSVLQRVRNELVLSAIRGESIPKMARRVAGTGLTQEGLTKPFGTLRKRAALIARVEIIKASDAGYEDMVQQAEAVLQDPVYDLWLTAGDERVDPPCNQLAVGGHGQFVPVAGYPGVYKRPNGPRPVLDTHLGCRCRRTPLMLRWLKEGLISLPGLQAA